MGYFTTVEYHHYHIFKNLLLTGLPGMEQSWPLHNRLKENESQKKMQEGVMLTDEISKIQLWRQVFVDMMKTGLK